MHFTIKGLLSRGFESRSTLGVTTKMEVGRGQMFEYHTISAAKSNRNNAVRPDWVVF